MVSVIASRQDHSEERQAIFFQKHPDFVPKTTKENKPQC